MVFGNLGDDSGTGVAFTRNPSTGERKFYGEFLVNAQGEDVVAGIRTPFDIEDMANRLPGAYEELLETKDRLEQHFRDMQDLEFTVERGKLFLLQTRTGKRTAAAAVRIAARWSTKDSFRATKPSTASRPTSSISFCTRSSIRRRGLSRCVRGYRRAPAQRAARRCSIPTTPSGATRKATP